MELVFRAALVGLFHTGDFAKGIHTEPGVAPHRTAVAMGMVSVSVADKEIYFVISIIETEIAVIAVEKNVVFVVLIDAAC